MEQLRHPSSPGGGGGSSHEVGEYIRDGSAHDLTDDHVEDITDGFRVDAPDDAAEIHVNPGYVEDRLGAWGADRAYIPTSDRVVVAGDTATFSPFVADTDKTFTRGSGASVRFADRPMWLAVDASSDRVVLSARDGDSSGQEIRVDATWLADRGIQDPLVHHEDGAVLDVRRSASGGTYVVDVPHFSDITVLDPNLDTSWKKENHTRRFAVGSTNRTSEFNITVANVTSDTITFRFWSVLNGSRNTLDGDEPFEKVGRESLNRSGYYTYNFINETNLVLGDAMLGDSEFDLVEVNTTANTYDFSNGNLTYQFKDPEGYLVRVYDERNGDEINMTATRWDAPSEESGQGGRDVAWLTEHEKVLDGWHLMVIYDDENNNPNWKLRPDWSGGLAQERVNGDLLSTDNPVSTKAKFRIDARVEADCSDVASCEDTTTCLDTNDCHVRSLLNGNPEVSDDQDNGWAVRYDEGGDDGLVTTDADVVAVCEDRDGCSFSTVTLTFYNETQGDTALDGRIHQEHLLDVAKAPFWACGRAQVWVNGGPTTGDKVLDKEICQTPWDSQSRRTDYVYIDPFLGLPG